MEIRKLVLINNRIFFVSEVYVIGGELRCIN